jgi:hypothetical protein
VPRDVEPSRNVTEPVGVFVPLAGVTVALKVTLAPCVAVAGPVSAVVVPVSSGAVMLRGSVFEVLAEKFESPAYFAVIECEPTARADVEYVAAPLASVLVPSELLPS